MLVTKFVRGNSFVQLVKAAVVNGYDKRCLSTTQSRLEAQKIDNIFVLGAGLMGSGIAQVCATSSKFDSITLQDVSNEQLDVAKSRIVSSASKLLRKGRLNVNSVEEALAKITFTTTLKPAKNENLLIIEAIPEILHIKQDLFKSLSDTYVDREDVIMVTNTSGLSVAGIGAHIKKKEKFAGLHFFNPVPLMQLVEIIKLMNTSKDTHDTLVQFVRDINKVGVTAKDVPGFIVNRLMKTLLQESLRMLERNDADFSDIDIAMKLGAGYPMGPFELMGADCQ